MCANISVGQFCSTTSPFNVWHDLGPPRLAVHEKMRFLSAVRGRRGYDGLADVGSCKSEHRALLPPTKGQPGLPHELGGGKTGRMAAFEDGLDDIRREECQPEKACEVGTTQPFTFCHVAEADTIALQ